VNAQLTAQELLKMTARYGWIGLFSAFLLTTTPILAKADEVKDDVRHDANDVKRTVKKGGHRVSEATCTATAAVCAARKGKHRVQEAGDKVGDTVDETKAKL
jgi:hypothetical protein